MADIYRKSKEDSRIGKRSEGGGSTTKTGQLVLSRCPFATGRGMELPSSNAKVIYDGLRQRMDGGRTQFLGFEPCLHSTDSKHFRQFPAKSHSSHDQGWMDGRWWRRAVREWDYCHHNNFQLLNMNLNWILSVLWSVSFSDVAHLSLISVQTSLFSLLSLLSSHLSSHYCRTNNKHKNNNHKSVKTK